MQSMTCPNCGAKIEVENEYAGFVKCKFCDSNIRLDTPAVDAREAAAMKRAETEQMVTRERLRQQEEQRLQAERQRKEEQERRDAEAAELRKKLGFWILLTIAGFFIRMIPLSFFNTVGTVMFGVGLGFWIYTGVQLHRLTTTVTKTQIHITGGDNVDIDYVSNGLMNGTLTPEDIMAGATRPQRTYAPPPPPPEPPKIAAPRGFRLEQSNYSEVRAMFEAAGFTNVSCVPLKDTLLGLLNDPGRVASVTIGGRPTNGGDNRKYPPDAPVVISYHSYLKEK